MDSPNQRNIKYDKYGYRLEDLESYKPKSYYIPPENEEELEHFLENRENSLKNYKYHDEIPMFF